MADINEQWLDAMIRHQIGLLRLSGSIRNRILKLLDETERDVKAEIERRLSRSMSTRSQELTIKAIRAIRNDAWKKSAEVWREEMLELVREEPQFLATAMQTVAPVKLIAALPAVDSLRALIAHHPFEGRVLRDWSRQVARADLRRIEQGIRIGIVQGETPQQIARRVVGTVQQRGKDGLTEISRRNATAITRTAVNSFSNAAKRLFYQANSDLFSEEIYVATLDSRTTPVCRSLDGKTFPIGKGPIPPLHWNCRSLRVASFDGEAFGLRPAKPVTQQQLLREYSKRHSLGRITSRDALPRGHKGAFYTFSRGRIRELTGQVDARVTYQEWLGRQSRDFQDDVLGPTRGRLFRRGGLTLDKFVNRQGDEITLAQLARRDAAAFRAAGLDPDDFR